MDEKPKLLIACGFLLAEVVFITLLILNQSMQLILTLLVLMIISFFVFGSLMLYGSHYFESDAFKRIRNGKRKYIQDYNILNAHINDLKNAFIDVHKTDYGRATTQTLDIYNYRRPELLNNQDEPNVVYCSRTVCDNAGSNPAKYFCKYFNINEDEKSLVLFESILNNYITAKEGMILLQKQKSKIIREATISVPWIITKLYSKKLIEELGFVDYQFDDIDYHTYYFRYVSAGGYASYQKKYVLDIPNLEELTRYLSDRICYKNSVEGQRRLMTPALRKSILKRDNYTCQNPKCNNSLHKEENLLLEVDHIIPISKGGRTTEDNLQTLCWRCNRAKGSKLIW